MRQGGPRKDRRTIALAAMCVAQVSADKRALGVHRWLFLDALHSTEEEGDTCVGTGVVLKLRMLHLELWLPKPTMVWQ